MRKKYNGFAVVFFSLYNFPELRNVRWQSLFRDSEEVPRIEFHRARVACEPFRPGRARAGHAPHTSKSLSVTIIQIQTALRHSYIAPVLNSDYFLRQYILLSGTTSRLSSTHRPFGYELKTFSSLS
jgi:hypothetical protein